MILHGPCGVSGSQDKPRKRKAPHNSAVLPPPADENILSHSKDAVSPPINFQLLVLLERAACGVVSTNDEAIDVGPYTMMS
ncbi:hypothetical protein E2562_007145 [Oryza meyeriana var. granulata]|uniref:Uncharacterized protein n=1 Tax=Oryza meyeriana var. granulata TaxID=110450 RepID=A0A6G1CDP1_9ORYZ|nr:hypothetical protein E2562_007145 [Oryza meyeriana var. granulata]